MDEAYYAQLVVKFDPAYRDMVAATEIVKRVIREKRLVLYGGTAIDYALRLRGDSIYSDDALAVPDLDFYSPTNVADSYALADELYAIGYEGARAINAQHMETMRVDLMKNHWIADITYRPAAIFPLLPFIEYDGMRVIHPDFQRIDVHSSLAFPYDNPPFEVVFARWNKDITRFNKLAAAYPIESAGPDEVKLAPMSVPRRSYVLAGMVAYAAIYAQFAAEMTALGRPIPDDVIAATFDVSADTVTFDSVGRFEIVHFDVVKAVAELGGDATFYEPYINLIPERAVVGDTVVYSVSGRLLAINAFDAKPGNTRVRMAGVQYQLRQMLSMYHAARMGYGAHANVYLNRYISLMRMINHIETARGSWSETPSVFYPSLTTYGDENVSLSHLVALSRIESDITGAPGYKLPANYAPGKANGRPPPSFSPDDIIFFQESGRPHAPAQSEQKSDRNPADATP